MLFLINVPEVVEVKPLAWVLLYDSIERCGILCNKLFVAGASLESSLLEDEAIGASLLAHGVVEDDRNATLGRNLEWTRGQQRLATENLGAQDLLAVDKSVAIEADILAIVERHLHLEHGSYGILVYGDDFEVVLAAVVTLQDLLYALVLGIEHHDVDALAVGAEESSTRLPATHMCANHDYALAAVEYLEEALIVVELVAVALGEPRLHSHLVDERLAKDIVVAIELLNRGQYAESASLTVVRPYGARSLWRKGDKVDYDKGQQAISTANPEKSYGVCKKLIPKLTSSRLATPLLLGTTRH